MLEKVGGPGSEFLVEGVNYPVDQGPSEYIIKRGDATRAAKYEEVPELMGRWRMEVRPGAARTEDVFLHLIQVGNRELAAMGRAEAAVEGDTARLSFEAGDRVVSLNLNITGPIGGHIQIIREGGVMVDRPLTAEVMPQQWLATPK